MTILIENNAQLVDFVNKSSDAPVLALDTEFFRRFSYRAKLCLIQVNNGTHSAAIDVLADGLDLAPLLDLIYRPDILKLLHAGRQDIEIFVDLRDAVPTPIFDTQIAAMACDIDPQPSYERVVKRFLRLTLDKSLQNQDWRARPLTQECLDYALSDVIHLMPLYEILHERLASQDRLDWIADELDRLQDMSSYRPDFDNLWQNIRGVKKSSAKRLAILQQIAAARERLAIKCNVPRKHIISDNDLLSLAESPPKSVEALKQMKLLVMRRLNDSDVADFYAAIDAGRAPERIDAMKRLPSPPGLGAGEQLLLDALQLIRKQTAFALGVAPKLLGASDVLESVVRDRCLPESLASGWRYQQLGSLIERFLQGDAALAVADDKLVVT